jgi:hypothetical protein
MNTDSQLTNGTGLIVGSRKGSNLFRRIGVLALNLCQVTIFNMHAQWILYPPDITRNPMADDEPVRSTLNKCTKNLSRPGEIPFCRIRSGYR